MLSASRPERKADFRRLLRPVLYSTLLTCTRPSSSSGTLCIQGVIHHAVYHNRNAFEVDSRTSKLTSIARKTSGSTRNRTAAGRDLPRSLELTLRAAKKRSNQPPHPPIIWDDMRPPTSTLSMSKESYLCF